MNSKIKELSKDTIVYGVSTILGKFLNFVLVPFYTQVFAPQAFGVFGYFYSFQAFLMVGLIFGMDVAYMKYASQVEERDKRHWYSTAFIAVLISSFFFSLAMIIFRVPIINVLYGSTQYESIIVLLAGILFFDVVSQVPFSNLRLRRKTVKFASIKLINILVNIAMNLILILVYKMGIESIFISNLVASAVMFVILIPDIYKNCSWRVNFEAFKKMLKFGIPYLPASLAAMIVQVIDRPLLKYLTNEKVLGVYQANYKLGIFMMLFVSMFQYAWQPFFLINANEKGAKELFSRVLTFFLIIASFIWVTISLFIEDFAKFQFYHGKTIIGSGYLGGLVIVPVILLGYLFHGMYVNFSAGVYIEEKTKYYPIVTGIGAILNVVVNITLIPVWGMMGAAIATLVAYMCMAAGLFIVTQKFYHVQYEYRKIISILAIIFVTGSVYYYMYSINALNLPYKFLILLGFILLMVLLRVVRINEIKSITRKLIRR